VLFGLGRLIGDMRENVIEVYLSILRIVVINAAGPSPPSNEIVVTMSGQ